MRVFLAAALAVTLITTGSFAATDIGPLAAGKPAGVKGAQAMDDTTLFWVLGLGVAAAGIAVIASGNSNSSLLAGTTTSTTATTATTSTTKTTAATTAT